MRITDDSGVQVITPVPDATAVDDFLIQNSTISLKLNAEIMEEDFIKIGVVASDTTVSGTGDEVYGDYKKRTIEFGNVPLILIQRGDNLGTKRWAIWEISVNDSGYVTPRGLSVGQDLLTTVNILGTGGLVYDLGYNNGKFGNMNIKKLDTPDKSNEPYEINLVIEDEKIAGIQMIYNDP